MTYTINGIVESNTPLSGEKNGRAWKMNIIRLEVKNKIGEKETQDYPEFRFWNNKDADIIGVGDKVEIEFIVRGRDISFKDKDGKTTLRHITELEGLGITYQTISNSDASDENNDLPF